ncbi:MULTISPECIES: hypothetical protein [unclassified Pseudomonas]|uniref:hypothetical protein n=1 Tax=unclassified Pseudomonas TaxID=196821 RepID=UPI002B23D25F|nr:MULTISPECIES: hypothetical protein [unclassified Pseudomonas]MEA9997206.1 hypothetical protein [Pseudomonas sp. AA4]MEB0088393.1 hypothetical protein [Pseudomonas sp. RTI1]MEB0128179.1 hypothetical protein [Pseudomonas sp. CCC1.2]MEB0155498.1 hypothetical protein [Pseudomonas sp. CCC4.3]MEB0221094.1 hypothetical protein [Pseudomonas sp. AB12(2023)]
MNNLKQGVSDQQRQQVIDLRRRHSFTVVAELTGLAIGTVKTIASRSGAFRDNEAHRALFCLPPMQVSAGTSPAVQELPPQQSITGDRDVDALLWLREVIGTGHPGHIEAAMDAATRIKTPFKQLEERYRDWLRVAHPNSLFAALSSFDLGNLEALATKSVEKLRRQAEARARFGDQIFSLTDAEVFCVSALDGLEPVDIGSFDNAEVAARFKLRPDLMPNTLSDCLSELAYWRDLYWLRHSVDRDGGDSVHEASARDWFVFEMLAEIRPRTKEEAKAVLRYMIKGDRGDSRKDLERVMDNLIG